MDDLCTQEDDFAYQFMEGNTRWVVHLDNGLTVFQDDLRPGLQEPIAWRRLQTYCKNTGHYITDMRIHFRSHNKPLPSNQEGYFFCRSIKGGMGMKKEIFYYLTGWLENGIIKVTKWRVPELLKQYEENRTIEQCQDFLILNPHI